MELITNNFIAKQIKFRFDNSKFYTIKIIVDFGIEKVPFIKDLFNKYANSALLYAFYSATVVNNLAFSDKNIDSGIRHFLLSLGSKAADKKFVYPYIKYSCPTHVEGNESCIKDILYVTKENIKILIPLYIKLGLLNLALQRKIDVKQFILYLSRSTAFLTVYPLLYRIYMCYITNQRGYNTLFDSQLGATIGSLGFLIESTGRQKTINKYMTGLYLHDITSQMDLTNEKAWRIIFIFFLSYSVWKRGSGKTLMSILL